MAEVAYPTDSDVNLGPSTPPTPPALARTSGNIVARVWGFEGQGWHPVLARSPNDESVDAAKSGQLDPDWMMQAQGMYYQSSTRTLWIATSNGHPAQAAANGQRKAVSLWCATVASSATLVENAADPARFEYRYKARGWLVLPPFDAGAVTLQKDWNSIAVYGSCFHSGSKLTCYYRLTKGIASALACEQYGLHYADTGWVNAGTKLFDATSALAGGVVEWNFPIPRTQSSTAIEIKFLVERSATAALVTPIINAIRLQHHDYIQDYYRFNLTVGLPGDCLTDACGALVTGYNRATYDMWIRDAVCKTVPVSFVDCDGQQYYVRVESASRRMTNMGSIPTTGSRNLDIAWSLVLTQLEPDSICDIVGPSPQDSP